MISRLTARVSRKWAGVESDWKREKLEVMQKAEKRADSHLSAARIVGRRFVIEMLYPLSSISRENPRDIDKQEEDTNE